MHIQLRDAPTLKPVPDWTKHDWIVVGNWEYTLPEGIKIIIPSGFLTDLVSIPRRLWSFISPFGSLLFAGIIHDFGYRYGYLWAINTKGELYKHGIGMPKDYWDDLFLRIANETNHNPAFNKFATSFLTLFGSSSWNKYRDTPQPELIVYL